jgi:sugar-specific transcriptional regulator TrmB
MTKHTIHYPILSELGLSESEALVFELLLESGKSRARYLVTESGLGRGNVYNVLTQLMSKGLVLEIQGKQKQYQAVDPSELRQFVDARLRKAKELEAEFSQALPQLTSAFNLSTGKPAIEIFEGYEGSKKAIEHSLNSQTNISTILDFDSLTGEFGEINKRYIKKRIAKGIHKRILVADTLATRKMFSNKSEEYYQYTQVGFLSKFPESFQTGTEIYDNTVAYFTFTDEKQISVLIHDPSIYYTQKAVFDFLWSQASIIPRKQPSSHSMPALP